ncbi:choice-of-anchor D domain-containing protein [Marinihelvus fidelis]|uniref:Choice-of-anchor D domain-containing protein n=1 Tax=Marinihelvus fidelis TaxID=2613842 RepID=A0A5N0T4I0_9GAMM|nr:M36 family metallopeptidase [Marinihelvus fidelis]KAA9129762.1 choice-of-anchor D domain-containing protein [Marinihelvus fidelis]
MIDELKLKAHGRVLTACVAALVCASAGAAGKPGGANTAMHDIDLRGGGGRLVTGQAARQLRAAAPAGQAQALADFERAAPGLQLRWSALTGAPSRIAATKGALTGPSAMAPDAIAYDFLARNPALLGLQADDIAAMRVARELGSSATGASYVTLQQQVNGIDVFGGRVKFTISPKGEVRSVSGEPIANVAKAASGTTPLVPVGEALALAAADARLDHVEFSRDHGLVWFPLSATELRLAWNVVTGDGDSPNAYRSLVDAVDGRVLWRQNLTSYAHQTAIGLAYTSDGPDPGTPSGTSSGNTPGSDPAGANPRQVLPFDGEDFFSHDDDHADWWNGSGEADYSRTVSNNVTARDDRLGDGSPQIVTTDPSGDYTVSPAFDIDLSQAPSTYINASVVNLFYWYNRLHDFWYGYGFDEAAGNAQVSNFGLGGAEGDPIIVDAQDNSTPADPADADNCNAFMRADTDGNSPSSRFLICDRGANGIIDAGLDNTVIAHEFGHLVVGRLLEGNVNVSQGSGMNEGFSDLFGLTIYAEADDELDAPYGIGGWYRGQPDSSIRREFYSTDPTVFTRRFADIVDGAFCAVRVCSNDDTMACGTDDDCGDGNTCDTASCGFQFQCEPPTTTISQGPCRAEEHDAGEIWANTLWIAYTSMVKKFGYGAAQTAFHQLVVDGLKGAPDFPDFLDMRDAILVADLDFQAGAAQCLLWDAFASMGMGVSASSLGSGDINVIEAFDTPPSCTPNIDVSITANIGLVCLDDDTIIPMDITNTGTGDLVIDAIDIQGQDAAEFSLDPSPEIPLVVPQGSTVSFTLHHVPAGGFGARNATVVITSNDPDEPTVSVPVSAEVGAPDINVAIADSGAFGNVCTGEQSDMTLVISNQGQCDLTIDDIQLGGTGASQFDLPTALDLPLVLAAGSDFNLPVRFSPDACTDSTYLAHVAISSDSPGEGTVNVPISGEADCPELVIDPVGLTGLNAFPATVVDTDGSLGCFSEKSAVLRNNSSCPLTITDISAANGVDFQVMAPTVFPIILPGGEETLETVVRFTPQSDADPLAPGELTDLLVVNSDDPDGAQDAQLCGESAHGSGTRILVTETSTGIPLVVDGLERLDLTSKQKNRPGPINLDFTDVPVTSTDVCGNTVAYHVNLETLPQAESTGKHGSQYTAHAKHGNLQTSDSFGLDQCEFRDTQLQLQDDDSGACLLAPKGAACSADSECCSGKCKGPSGNMSCK